MMRRFAAQLLAELTMTLRRGESLLVTLAIPVILLVFFSEVHVLPGTAGSPVTFLAPGVLALAVMGTALVNLAIATGYERSYGVLKRLGMTPLGRPALLGAKIGAVVAVEVLQVAVVVIVGVALGWHPVSSCLGQAAGVLLLATAGFAGAAMLIAGTLRAETTLALANGVFILLLLVSGMLAPLTTLPGWLEGVARALPAAALAQGLHHTLGTGAGVGLHNWLVLVVWAILAPALAARFFRWE